SPSWCRVWCRAFALLHRSVSEYLFVALHWDSSLFPVWRALSRGVWLRISTWISFCPNVSAMDCDGSYRSRRPLAGGWMGPLTVDGHHLGNSHWRFCLGRSPGVPSKYRRACLCAPFFWVPFEFVRSIVAEISFPLHFSGY